MIRALALACLAAAGPLAAKDLPLVARGNEPGWVLTLAAEGILLSTEEGERLEMPLPQAQPLGMGLRYDAGPDLAVEVLPILCHDSMTGMPYPASVSVIRDGTRLAGCGGDPATLLAGAWQVTELGSAAVAGVTLEIEGDRVAGQAPCNRYSAGLRLTGETLTFTAPVATRMACAAEAMQAETAFLAALGRVTGFDIDTDGTLLLTGDGTGLLRARR